MDKIQACQLFGLAESATQEEIETVTEEKLFHYKNEVLQKYMVPALLKNKLQTLQELALAESLLRNTGPQNAVAEAWTSDPADRISFIEEYEEHTSHLKLATTQSNSFGQLHSVIRTFIVSQEYYMVLFKMLFSEFSEALPEEVNTRQIIDTGKLLLALKSGTLDNKQTWEIELEITRIDKLQKLK